MFFGRYLICFISCVLSSPAFADELADDFVSGWEFEGVFQKEETVISEDFLVQNSWSEPEFSAPESVRDIASLESVEDRLESDGDTQASLIGRLEVLEEIPYTYPWLKRWQVRNKVLRYRSRRRAARKSSRQ